MLPYQGVDGVDDQSTLRSPRLKRWIVGMGRKERERLRAFEKYRLEGEVNGLNGSRPTLLHFYPQQEISSERGVVLVPEGKGLRILCITDLFI